MSTGMGSGKGKSRPPPSDPSILVSDKINAREKYALIPDRFTSLDQVYFFPL